MGGGRAVRRRAVWSRCHGAVVVAAVVLAVTSGCVGDQSSAKEPNEVDESRAQALLDDPWLGASEVTMTSYQRGSNDLYRPTTSGAVRPQRGTPEESVLAEVEAAQDAGWRPYYAQCAEAPPRVDVPNQLVGRIEVQLARPLADGGVLLASVLPDGADVVILAVAPNHAAPPTEPPPPIDLRSLACFSDDGEGPEYAGDVLDITAAS